MEKQIAELLNKELKYKGITKYQLKEMGINQSVYQAILKIGKYQDKTYTLKSLVSVLNALNIGKLELVIHGNKFTLSVK